MKRSIGMFAVGQAERPAFRFISGVARPHRDLWRAVGLTNRFANVLRSLGIGKGDRLFILSGRIPNSISPYWAA